MDMEWWRRKSEENKKVVVEKFRFGSLYIDAQQSKPLAKGF